ncbi:TPA: hypothetical protein ACH3X3_014620 [Trebouxia sp. C0006]
MLCPSKSKGEVPGLSASEQRTFLQSLWEHLRGNGMVQPTTQCAVAEVEGKVVSAARLYRAVGLRGGFDNVSKRDWWRSIGQEFGTSVAADGVWRSKYELLLKGYEDKYLDASKYCSKADAVVSSVDRQYASSSDSPAISTAAESQPSSSSSCLDGAGPSIQSGPTMESSATASPSQDRHAPATHQPAAQSTEAASSLSNGRPSGGTNGAQPQHQHPTSLHHPEQSDLPVGLQKQQGADKQLQLAEAQPQKAETQLQKAETQPAQRESSPKTNGSLGTHDKQEGHQSSQQTEAQPCAPPDASASDMPCQQGPSTSAPSTSRITPPHLRQSTPEKQLATDTTPAAAISRQPAQGSAKASSLPSGAYMIPLTAATLSASPQTSPVAVPLLQPVSGTQQPQQPQPQQQQQQQSQQLQHPQSQQQHQLLQQQQIQQQQQLMQQRRYQMLIHQQAQLQQASLQRSQAQPSSLGRPPLQQSFLSLQPQQARPSTPVAPLRSAQPVWPVPAPRPASGKRHHIHTHV